MRSVLPGRPESRLQALCTGYWDSKQITVRRPSASMSPVRGAPSRAARLTRLVPFQAYISGNAFTILTGPQSLLQTVYDDDESPLVAIAFDEASGKIAACTLESVRVYKPFGRDEDALRVGRYSGRHAT